MNGKLIEDWEKEFIKDNYLTLSDEQISHHLKRSYFSVVGLRRKLKCFKLGANTRFTAEEKFYIKTNFLEKTNLELAKGINRTDSAIINYLSKHRMYRQGLRRKIYNPKIINAKVKKMKTLISLCETTQSPYKKDLYKQELKKLSGL